jgi:hypothetical protein
MVGLTCFAWVVKLSLKAAAPERDAVEPHRERRF